MNRTDIERLLIEAGLDAKILSLSTIIYRLRETIMETEERQRANRAIEEDSERQERQLLSVPKYMTELPLKAVSLIPTLLPWGEGLFASLSRRERD